MKNLLRLPLDVVILFFGLIVSVMVSGGAVPRQERANERLSACLSDVLHNHYLPSDDEQFWIRSCQDVYRMEVTK